MAPLEMPFVVATQILETLQQVGNDLEDLIIDISITLHADTLKLILKEEGMCPIDLESGQVRVCPTEQEGRGCQAF